MAPMTPAKIAAETGGLTPALSTLAVVPATKAAAVDALLAILSEESSQAYRGHLDEMSPAAHRQLLAELAWIKALAA